jgi:hypothetical protein
LGIEEGDASTREGNPKAEVLADGPKAEIRIVVRGWEESDGEKVKGGKGEKVRRWEGGTRWRKSVVNA